MKYNLTIKDNETGEVIKNLDFDALFAGVHLGEQSVSVSISHTNTLGLISALQSAKKAIAEGVQKDPMIELALRLLEDAESPVEDLIKPAPEEAKVEEPTEAEGD